MGWEPLFDKCERGRNEQDGREVQPAEERLYDTPRACDWLKEMPCFLNHLGALSVTC